MTDAIRGGERKKDVEATVVGGGRREVKAAGPVFRPRLPVRRRVVGDHELPGWRNRKAHHEDHAMQRVRDWESRREGG